MDGDSEQQGFTPGVRRIGGRAGSWARSDPKGEYPELSTAAFQYFLLAANDSDLEAAARAHYRARVTRLILAVLLILLAALTGLFIAPP